MRRTATLVNIIVLLLVSLESVFASEGVSYVKMKVRGVPVNVITVNLNSPLIRVSPAIARHGVGTAEGFGSMISRLKPAAAITGTYFCTRSFVPVGDIVIAGQKINYGVVGTVVCFKQDNTVEFKSRYEVRGIDWSGYECAIASGPWLIRNGIIRVQPRAEGFRDGGIFRAAQRSALGVRKNNKLLLVSVNRPIHLTKLAAIMHDLGAVNAINLDGGSSTALHCKGRVFSHPGRKLTNVLVIYDSPIKYDRIRPSLAPNPIMVSHSTKS